jgi:hypothetical protein
MQPHSNRMLTEGCHPPNVIMHARVKRGHEAAFAAAS